MLSNTIMISLGASILSILLVLGLRRNILKQPEGGKRIIDAVKIVSTGVKKDVGKQNMVLFPMVAATFVLIMYFLNWQTALAFLASAMATILINLILPHIVAQNSGLVVEATRKSMIEGANIALKSGVVSASLILGLSLFITASIYAIFQSNQILFGLGFGSVIVALYLSISKRKSEQPKMNPDFSISLFALNILVTITVMILAKTAFAKSTNPTLLALVMASASTISFLVSSFLIRFFKSTKKFQSVILLPLAVQLVLFAVAAYFSKMWLIKDFGFHSFLNFYGLALLALIIFFLTGMAILLNIYYQVLGNASGIAENTESSEDIKKNLLELRLFDKLIGFINKIYVVKGTALVSLVVFAAYYKVIQKSFPLDLGNYLVLIGLFLGLLVIALFNWQKVKIEKESLVKNVSIVAVFVLLPVLVGVFLGPVALGGYVIAIILLGLFSVIFISTTFSNVVLITTTIALLIASSIV